MNEQRRIKPTPKTQAEILYDLTEPYGLTNYGKGAAPQQNNNIIAKPDVNRAEQISVKKSKIKDFSIGLQDIDESILYYFENVIRPTVIQGNKRLPVPILYGSPERWSSVQKEGFLRDQGGKLMAPLVMFKRTGFTNNRGLGNKLDANNARNFLITQTKFNRRNQYNSFDILTNRTPVEEYVGIIIPNYVTITYDVVIFTDYVEQNNKIVEAINFAENSYWGQPERFQFRAMIDNVTTQTELTNGEDRAIRNTFTINLNGYIIPDTINAEIAKFNRYYSKGKVVINFNTTTESEQFEALQKAKSTKVNTSRFIDSTVTSEGASLSSEAATYLTQVKQLTGINITSNTVEFNSSILAAPSGFPATSTDDFTFFINGQLVEPAAITSFANGGAGTILTLDVGELGYSLEASDEIIGIGKFA
jgi:hypothetical protein